MRIETSEVEKLRIWLDEAESKWRPRLEPALERWRAAGAELETLLADERKALETTRNTLARLHSQVETRLEEITSFNNLIPNREEQSNGEISPAVRRKLDVNTRELATLSRMLRTAEDNARWLSDVSTVLQQNSFWWRFMPTRWQRRKQAKRLQKRGLFDGAAYLARYPDVVQADMDPLRHYMLHGQAEGRLR